MDECNAIVQIITHNVWIMFFLHPQYTHMYIYIMLMTTLLRSILRCHINWQCMLGHSAGYTRVWKTSKMKTC